MPFGKKKKAPAGGSSYPKQASYPTQAPLYPQQAEAPPPYLPPGQYPPPPTQQYAPQAPGYPASYQPPVPVGQFEAGARFKPGESVSVPPPPPGVAPTMVQMQAAQGVPVQVQQKSSNLFSGGGDGGINFELN
ncbi:hypothetical protein LOD99_12918 [Oopsacas minuta]|uniref:DAZ-associated protein 2 n=1 Tax=Oopsacas minuta TaxID=111878 RepID=A0AAV7JA70_9METZ|nr:hypothetical protein LOD99_12918 [Oopsacas minuta]